MPANELAAWAANWQPDPRWASLQPVRGEALPALFAGTEHRAWVRTVEKSLAAGAVSAPAVGREHCRFGKWLADAGATRHGARSEFAEITRLHDDIHALADLLCDPGTASSSPERAAGTEKLRELSDALLSRLKMLVTEVAE